MHLEQIGDHDSQVKSFLSLRLVETTVHFIMATAPALRN